MGRGNRSLGRLKVASEGRAGRDVKAVAQTAVVEQTLLGCVGVVRAEDGGWYVVAWGASVDGTYCCAADIAHRDGGLSL